MQPMAALIELSKFRGPVTFEIHRNLRFALLALLVGL